jgi:hypothetical protein
MRQNAVQRKMVSVERSGSWLLLHRLGFSVTVSIERNGSPASIRSPTPSRQESRKKGIRELQEEMKNCFRELKTPVIKK